MGLNLLPRQGGWCHLRCPWTAGIGFSYHYRWAQVSHRSCVTPPSLNRPLKWLRTSPMEGGNHALITEFHPIHLHTNLMQLYPRVCQKVSPDPGDLFFPDTQWKVGLTIWEKTPNTSEARMDFLHSFLSAQSFPFLLPDFCGKMSSDPSLTWLSQIHLYPDCQAEINQERLLFPSFLHLFPISTFHSSTYIRTMAIFFHSLTNWELGL